ncbi:lipocalin family protein [Autumnicola musiva]|uniref:Lipocalin family protein n=1 Tax=Autumnicola musiva TaxID=3075589 RepID=A0ABU3D3G7_9FLAO|nr:lipocalin family protein [Zunongwangia sp. F117]MDT0676080.1 lipocalin family protein [Zunongwangia sp. F117]
MKTFLHLSNIAVFLLIFGCNSEDEEITVLDVSIQNLTGTWKLTEVYVSPGGETEWRPVANGHTYTFSGNGTFSSTGLDSCKEGEYSLNDDTLNLNCGEESLVQKIDSISSGVLILKNPRCIEACLYKYKKVD